MRKKLIHQTLKALPPPYFNVKPKQSYPLRISFPGFHCRLCSARLLFLCWDNMQSKKVLMSVMVPFCCSFMLIFLCSSLFFSVPPPVRVTYRGCRCSVVGGSGVSGHVRSGVSLPQLPTGVSCWHGTFTAHSTSATTCSLYESLKPCPRMSPVPAGWLFMCARAGILCCCDQLKVWCCWSLGFPLLFLSRMEFCPIGR